MPQWYVGVQIRASEPMTDSVLDRFDGFRPKDEDQCVWVDQDDNTLLNVTIELPVPDPHAALNAGRELARDAMALLEFAARVVDVVAEDVDNETGTYYVWTPTADDSQAALEPPSGAGL